MHSKVTTMTRTALMAAVTAVVAQIAIPLPFSPVPFTLQVLAVILSGLLLGLIYGALAQAIYVLVGRLAFPSSPSSGAGWLAVMTRLPFAAALAQRDLPLVSLVPRTAFQAARRQTVLNEAVHDTCSFPLSSRFSCECQV